MNHENKHTAKDSHSGCILFYNQNNNIIMLENEKPENPPAFPTTENYLHEGMILRDYFANSAMQAMISNPNVIRPGEQEKDFAEFSKRSYRYADAMLKQRI